MTKSEGYAGDLSCREAWDRLASDTDAVLVDVRTQAEWDYVGVPSLRDLDKQPLLVSWQVYPDMHVNPDFAEVLAAQGVRHETTLLVLCRSGSRSREAAIALTALGFERCYNVADGFEGPRDDNGRRGMRAGWKAETLPWAQG